MEKSTKAMEITKIFPIRLLMKFFQRSSLPATFLFALVSLSLFSFVQAQPGPATPVPARPGVNQRPQGTQNAGAAALSPEDDPNAPGLSRDERRKRQETLARRKIQEAKEGQQRKRLQDAEQG